ncbi:MAG: hypothetical protein NUV74_06100 [Candidatus Brocadiaceae bacterium]|nr:hypothetical protein [Candidatus Brocadiaceae bacterium]
MSRCLKVLKEVAIPVENNRFLFVDIFLTENYFCVVPYAAFAHSHSDIGQFTLSGMLMGGIGGLIVGTAIDSIKDSIFGGKADDLESAKKKAKLQREKDFGKPVDERVKRQRGVRLPKEKVTSVDCKDGWCTVTSSQEQTEIVPLFGLGGDSLEIAETVKKWFSGNLPMSAREGVEGASVGMSIEDFVSSFEKTTNLSISSETLKSIAEDSSYIKSLRDYIFTLKRVRKIQVLNWITRHAKGILDEMFVDLEKELQRQYKKFNLLGILKDLLGRYFYF